MPWRLVDLCCGSGSVPLHCLEEDPELFPYQGGKSRFAASLRGLFLSKGAWGQPDQLWLSDVGPWALLFKALHDSTERPKIEALIRIMVKDSDPKGLLGEKAPDIIWNMILEEDFPEDELLMLARLLFLQRFSFRGKAIGVRDGRWITFGINRSSAYGAPASDTFGAIGPQGPSLLEKLGRLRNFPVQAKMGGPWTPAELLWDWLGKTVVLLDPPYAGTLGYPSGDLARAEAVQLALEWAEQPNTSVFYCESGPVEQLVEVGWDSKLLTEDRGSQLSGEERRAEWVTISPRKQD